ncbi:MAG: BamA/TamA family outer membrane protein [Bacteroidota bacterium]
MRAIYTLFTFLIGAFLLSSCLNTNKLRKDEYLLTGQRIKGNKDVSSDDLAAFYQQKPNRKILGTTPYLWIYYQGKRFHHPEKIQAKIAKTTQAYDQKISDNQDKPKKLSRLKRKKEKDLADLNRTLHQGNYLMRVVGERPIIFDSTLAHKTAKQMQSYLFTKGYFEGTASYQFKLDTAKKTAAVTYQITEGIAQMIRHAYLDTDDKHIDSLLKAYQDESLIKPGDQYDERKFDSERERIEKLLKDNGYFEFSRQYIHAGLDTAVIDTIIVKKTPVIRTNILDFTTEIYNPAKRDKHKIFVIDEIKFTTDAGNQRRSAKRDSIIFNHVKYLYYVNKYSKKVLDSKLLFHPGEKYNQTNIQGTQRLLNGLNIFKFANLKFDTTNHKFVANIFTSDMEKYEITDEIGLTVLQSLPGPFGNVTFRVRNVFGGLEIFEVSARAGIEGQTGLLKQSNVYATTQVGVTSSIVFPQLIFPGKFAFKNFINKYDPRTRVGIGFDLINRPEYRRVNLRGAVTYTWQKNRIRSFSISPIDINYVFSPASSQTDEFKAYLDSLESEGNPLKYSFNNSFVTSINGFYQYNDNLLGQNKIARYFRLFLEAGGTWLNFLGKEQIEQTQKGRNLQYFSFYRINPDFRYYLPTGKKSTLAMRISTGLAVPYGTSKTLPYEKFYFSGGGNSLRAWTQRRLGPGSIKEKPISDTAYVPEKPGNILLEANIEYRFKMFSFFNGAFFVDAGNVWTLKNEKNQEGGQFRFDRFYKEIAVDAGYGLRLDFSFLIVRVDAAVRVYDPSEPEGDRYVLNRFQFKRAFDKSYKYRSVVNLSIGYPF